MRTNNKLDHSCYWWVSIAVFCLLGIIAYSLSVNFSKDWPQYLNMFEKKARRVPWEIQFDNFTFFSEALYLYASKGFGSILGFPSFIFITTVALLVLKLRYLEKIVGVMFGGLFFYVCIYLFSYEGTALRIAFATTFVVMAIYYLKQDRPFLSLLLLLVASQIHITSLIFISMILIYYWRPSTAIAYLLFAIAPLFIIFEISILSFVLEVAEYFNPRFIVYDKKEYLNQNSTGLFFYFVAFFTIIVSVTQYYLGDLIHRDRFVRTMQTLCILGVAAMSILHDRVVIASRLGDLLLLPVAILLGLVLIRLDEKKMKYKKYMLISVFLSLFFAKFNYLYPNILGSFI